MPTNNRAPVRDEAPQIGIVSVSYAANGEVGLMAVEAGLHILTETPIAHQLSEADAVIAAAQRRGMKIEVAEQFHRRPLEQLKLKLIASGLFGRVYSSFNDFAGHGYHGTNGVAGLAPAARINRWREQRRHLLIRPTDVIFTHRFRVRYAETDAMRVAHHAAYLVWFEEGRVELLRSLGFDFGDLEAAGYGQAVREARLQYRRPLRFDQRLALRIAVVAASGPRLVFGYRLFDAREWEADRQAAPPVAVGCTEMVWVTTGGRPTRLPAAHPLAAILAGIERHADWAEW